MHVLLVVDKFHVDGNLEIYLISYGDIEEQGRGRRFMRRTEQDSGSSGLPKIQEWNHDNGRSTSINLN